MNQKTPDGMYTASGIPLKRIYTSEDVHDLGYERDLGDAGSPPYTRGAYPQMYRERMWRIKQLSGLDTAEESHERLKMLINAGETGITLSSSGVCFNMYDVDHPEIMARLDDLGIDGTIISSLRDYEELVEGIPLDKHYVGIILPPMAFTFGFGSVLAIAEKQGIAWKDISGTGMNEMILPYLACPTKELIPPRHSLRLLADEVEFCIENMPKFMPVSYCGNDCRETGCNAYQELAIVFAHAIALIEELLQRGRLNIDDFGYMVGSAAFNGDSDFFEEIAKFRAARRMWYKIMGERFHAKDPRSLRLRIHVETAGSKLTYQQPQNNIIRIAYQTLVAALGGVQSISSDAWDEPISTPSQESALLAIRTQQIAQYEIGINKVVDPLAGSYYVEWLTNEIEQKAWDYLKQIEDQGGFVEAIESGWLHGELAREMYQQQREIESGNHKLVGVNCFRSDEEISSVSTFRTSVDAGKRQLARLEQVRKERNQTRVDIALNNLRCACEGRENVVPAVLEAVKVYATIGEIGQVYRDTFSVWQAPIGL